MTFSEYMLQETGYKTITTFWEDFSIADRYGTNSIKDTFNRAFNEWKSNYKYLTELVIVLNYKSWYYNERNDTYSQLYAQLWEKADAYACDNLTGEELEYFYSTTD